MEGLAGYIVFHIAHAMIGSHTHLNCHMMPWISLELEPYISLFPRPGNEANLLYAYKSEY